MCRGLRSDWTEDPNGSMVEGFLVPKVHSKTFLCMLAGNRKQINDQGYVRWGISCDMVCVFSRSSIESRNHLSLSAPFLEGCGK